MAVGTFCIPASKQMALATAVFLAKASHGMRKEVIIAKVGIVTQTVSTFQSTSWYSQRKMPTVPAAQASPKAAVIWEQT